jgi:hypothetical protein
LLKVPPDHLQSVARCGRCHERIRIFKIIVSDDAVAGWLTRDIEDEDALELAQEQAQPAPASLHAQSAASGHIAHARQAVGIAPLHEDQGLRLVRVDHNGVLFEFPASKLLEPHFRLAMPRSCLHCGTRAHLQAHVIIFAGRLHDSISLEAEHSAGSMVLSADEVKHMSDQDFLSRLPRVPNVPHPFNAPMPFWLCDMCNAAGAISGQIEVNEAAKSGHCQLLVRNMRRSLEFMAGAGNGNDPQYAELAKLVTDTAENPWDTLSIVVQHRVQQWFQPQTDETFIAYVPDGNHTRTEDGMAGILITNQRLIHHITLRQLETPVTEPLWLQLATAGVRARLHLKTPTWEIGQFTMGRPGVDVLRRGLMLAKFQTTWT